MGYRSGGNTIRIPTYVTSGGASPDRLLSTPVHLCLTGATYTCLRHDRLVSAGHLQRGGGGYSIEYPVSGHR